MLKRKFLLYGSLAVIVLLISLLIIYQNETTIVDKSYAVILKDDASNKPNAASQLVVHLKISKRVFTEDQVAGIINVDNMEYNVTNKDMVNSAFQFNNWIDVNEIVNKWKGQSYRLTDTHYSRENNMIMRTIEIDLNRNFGFLSGVINIQNKSPIYIYGAK